MKKPSGAGAGVLFWFRRDLRVADNAGLARALQSGQPVCCVFVFDRDILDALPSRADRRVEFIWESVRALKSELMQAGGDLIVLHDRARHAVPALARRLDVTAVYANEDYEPDAIARDAAVSKELAAEGRALYLSKDQAVFARDELLTQAGKPYTVFTPYKSAWLKRVTDADLASHPSAELLQNCVRPDFSCDLPTLEDLGFERTNLGALGIQGGSEGAAALLDEFMERIDAYKELRDFPARRGVSYLSVHNRFGTISVRHLARLAHERRTTGADTWLSELIWRDFYFQILFHFPHVAGSAFRPEYDGIRWPNDPARFAAWCEGRTGYPVVDAAMRQLNQTGFMHNRLRMIAASFLTKDLHVDWRQGEAYFAQHLNDFDLSANNGGWQWSASTGCDAQPYFRIFNPVTQSEKFDPEGRFIRRYVPELKDVTARHIHAPWKMTPLEQQAAGCIIGRDYPQPIVDHAVARAVTLDLYKR